MTLRIFTPEEDAVFEQICKQREESDPNEDHFVYFVDKGQKGLQSNGKAVEYGIGSREQIKIIRKLTKDGILDANWIVSRNSGRINLEYHDEKWLQDNYFSSFYVDFYIDDIDYHNYFFVQLDFSRIRIINDSCRAIYPCELLYDKDQYSFYVRRKDNDETYFISKLKKDMMPFQVLLYAYNSKHMHATREGMNKSGDRRVYIGKASIATRVFAKKSVVRNELSPFVTLGSEDIDINKEADLTFNQLKALEMA